MAQHQVTVNGQVLHQMFVGDDGPARLVEEVLSQVLEAQATLQVKAKRYEGSEKRLDYRDGYRPRAIDTRVGRVVLSVSRFLCGEFSTRPLCLYGRTEAVLLAAMVELVVNAVCTPQVRGVVKESFKRLKASARKWNRGDLSGKKCSFLFVDVPVIRVKLSSVSVATGMNQKEQSEVPGVLMGRRNRRLPGRTS